MPEGAARMATLQRNCQRRSVPELQLEAVVRPAETEPAVEAVLPGMNVSCIVATTAPPSSDATTSSCAGSASIASNAASYEPRSSVPSRGAPIWSLATIGPTSARVARRTP